MQCKNKQLATAAFLLILTGAFFFRPFPAHAQWIDIYEICSLSGLPCTDVYDVLSALLRFLLAIFTLFAIISFIVSGLMFITSGGEEDRLNKAKTMLQFSIIGIIVALSGYIVINLVDSLLRGIA
jgi:hypothetical protein